MRHCYVTMLVVAMLAVAGCQKSDEPTAQPVGWELPPPAADATAVDAVAKMRGIYPVGSLIEDRDAPGGFGPCNNLPNDLAGRKWGTKGELSVVAFPDEPVAYFKHRGFALRVVNRTSADAPFTACDSSLYLVCEAKDASGEWREIESRPQTFCGNSFHRVFLGSGQYWQFPAREYAGPVKTKLRFRLDPGDDKLPIYSNEFEGQVAASQFAGR